MRRVSRPGGVLVASCHRSGSLACFQSFSRLIGHASYSTPALSGPSHQRVWRLGAGMQVLTYPAVFKRRLPLLLACNKADQGARAHTVDFLRRRLEREVAALALTPFPCPLPQCRDAAAMRLCVTGQQLDSARLPRLAAWLQVSSSRC